MASRMIASRLTTSMSTYTNVTTRSLSSQGAVAVERLRSALAEYKAENYTRCIPSRFQKDIVKAATTDAADDRIALDGMQRVISNIRMEHKVSHSDMETIFREIGGSKRTIPADRLMQIIA